MTGNDLAFLLIGLLAGVGIGALIAGRSRRLGPTQKVRVTVAPNAIPRRPAATLAEGVFDDGDSAARGGPADPWAALPAISTSKPPDRTPVRPMVAPTFAFAAGGSGGAAVGRLVPVPMGGNGDRSDPIASLAMVATATLERTAVPIGAAAASADEDHLPDPARGTAEPPTPVTAPTDRSAPSGPCAELRTVADERCEVAQRARAVAERAQETLRAAQRSYDDHLARAEEAGRVADPRTVRELKDRAQQTFRAARGGASDPAAVDAAARDWLLEVNRINQEARTAAAAAARDQEAARLLASSLDRLTVEADAARISAEAADEGCLAAREAAADCEERLQAEPAHMPAMPSGAPSRLWVDDPPLEGATASALAIGSAPTIFRLLQGDRVSLVAVVERLAGEDPEARRAWQLAISDLVDAILATAIEASALEFPEDHAFWGPFTIAQARDIVAALASLGYHFDGLGGWQDGRVPSQRDLSLALGYAGLDPMRIRTWPKEGEMAELFRDVSVAAPEYLAGSAGDLTLGELVSMLGHRADHLTDVWNNWGRIRPLLLEER